MSVHQISIFLENRAGQLAEITHLLADKGVNLRALNIAETKDYGVLRLIVDDAEKATAALLETGCILSMTPVMAVIVPDVAGGLAEVLDVLKEIGDQLEDIDATLDEYGEEIDAISDDLSDVEDVVFEEEEDEDDEGEYFDDEDFFEVDCPNCGADICIDEAVLEAGVVECPACHQEFAIDLTDDCGCDEECDCED